LLHHIILIKDNIFIYKNKIIHIVTTNAKIFTL